MYDFKIKKCVYDKLDDIANKYNNTYHRTIIIKPSIYIDFNKENNRESPNFKVSNHVRISKYRFFFAKVYAPNWSEEVFMIKKIENTVLWIYVISNFNHEENFGTFYKKEWQKTNQK